MMSADQFGAVMDKLDAILAAVSGRPTAASAPAPTGNGGGACFGNYGRSKNQPVAGASLQDLEYYASGCRRTLADSSKSKFHGRERTLLAAIETEISRQSGGTGATSAGTQGVFDAADEVPF